MSDLRALLLRYRWLAMFAFASALAMKALVPAGFMIVSHNFSIDVVLCSGMGEQRMVSIPVEREGKADVVGDKQVCHGSALDKAVDSGADATLIADALAFILALGFAAVCLPLLRSPRFLSPPLRGPPLTI